MRTALADALDGALVHSVRRRLHTGAAVPLDDISTALDAAERSDHVAVLDVLDVAVQSGALQRQMLLGGLTEVEREIYR